MAGYFGYNIKFLLRNLAMSPLVLPWAIEQHVFSWKQTEVPAAITMLSERKTFCKGDMDLRLTAFDSAGDLYQDYLSAHEEGGKVKPKMVSNEKRVEALVRILITVDEELEILHPDTDPADRDQLQKYYKDHREQVGGTRPRAQR